MKSLYGIIYIGFVLFMTPFVALSQDISVLTTTWTPYAYEENGKITGLSTEIVQAILKKAGLNGNIQLYPWNRAIVMTKTHKNILIYPLMRIKQREFNFIWVAPIFNAKLSLFKLKKNKEIIVSKLEDAKNHTIGVLKGAAMHQFLNSKGFEDNKQLQIFYSNQKSIELLFRERLDMIADNPLVVSYEIKQLNRSNIKDVTFSMDLVEEIVPLTQSNAYMAFGKDCSPEYVVRLRKAWEELEAQGAFKSIFDRYR
ncbi:MAG: transporter substrate-binding domain-containing protein [Desulfobacterales bacterium]|nr:transporter substrate-binding domain-containing protein [Desulfobacterales bacterium]